MSGRSFDEAPCWKCGRTVAMAEPDRAGLHDLRDRSWCDACAEVFLSIDIGMSYAHPPGPVELVPGDRVCFTDGSERLTYYCKEDDHRWWFHTTGVIGFWQKIGRTTWPTKTR